MPTKGKTLRKKAAPKKAAKSTARKTAAKKSKSTAKAKPMAKAAVSQEARHRMIAEAAYKIAALRRFQDADPVGDWLAAEREIDKRLASGAST